MHDLVMTPTAEGVLATYHLDDGDTLQVAITPAGVAFDAYCDDGEEWLGTLTATADEWFDRLDG